MEQFTIRVYGILMNEKKEVLVTDELIRGKNYTKFPGGGLEYGEGTRDCLKREFKEEMDLEVSIGNHIYTTDYFQPSVFGNAKQIIAIYYFAQASEPIKVPLSHEPFQFNEAQMKQYESQLQTESFRFVAWDDLIEDTVTLPLDKVVVTLLKQHYS